MPMVLTEEHHWSLMVYLEREEKNLPYFSPVIEREQVHTHLGCISIVTHLVHTVEKLSNLTLLNVDTK